MSDQDAEATPLYHTVTVESVGDPEIDAIVMCMAAIRQMGLSDAAAVRVVTYIGLRFADEIPADMGDFPEEGC